MATKFLEMKSEQKLCFPVSISPKSLGDTLGSLNVLLT